MAEIIPVGQSKVFDYTGNIQSIELPPGEYKLEVWGAQGGSTASYAGGKGGYSYGTLSLASQTTLYVVVGGQGTKGPNSDTTVSGGYNGGGRAYGSSNSSYVGASGGGATHIGLKSGLLTTFSSDYSSKLLLVAGAGAGGGNYTSSTGTGGHGGGATGGDGVQYDSYGLGKGGSQTAGGTTAYGGSYSNYTPTNGGFGYGGYCTSSAISGGWHGGGGGAGFYGGGAGGPISSGGGGSGYVNTSTLTDAQTIAGNTSFPNTAGTGTETGHSGNGYAKITCLAVGLLEPSSSITFNYTGEVQSVTLAPGRYKLETWGAQGGIGYSNSVGAKGGYSVGIITLRQKTTMYIYVGGNPGSAVAGGFNGGGSGNLNRNDNGGGGGGTDIRIGADSLYARVIVAGGGGGGCHGGTAGYGGGVEGGTSNGGSQTSAGPGGSFGQGANIRAGSGYPTGGAGGGWYGGGGITNGANNYGGNGGGSGYVYTEATASSYPNGCLLNSSYYLAEAFTIAGNSFFIGPDGITTETGHSGHGAAKITPLTNSGERYTFNYTGGSQNITLRPGIYQLEVFGASGGQGADGTTSNTSWNFGYGGYSKGTLTLHETTTLYIHVGGRGLGYNGSYHTAGVVAGGYNGGGNAYHDGGEFGGSGGGATHIALSDGILSSLSSKVEDILLVAGGGGGSGEDNETAGHGGSAVTSPTGHYNVDSYKGSFGQGSHYSNTGESGGGGGGGYYGGYGGQGAGSNGGTGYASSILTKVEGSTGINVGNGYAVITSIIVNSIYIDKIAGIESVSSTPDVMTEAIPENTLITISATMEPGYKFDRWDIQRGSEDSVFYTDTPSFQYYYTNSDELIIFTAYAIPRTNTPYTVNHYTMTSDGETYTLYKTETLQGTTDTKITPAMFSLSYYITPSAQTVIINGDGSTVVDYYYERQRFHIKTLPPVLGGENASIYDKDVCWGSSVYLTVATLPGYTFTAWIHDETGYVYTKSQHYPLSMPTQDLTLRPLFTPHNVTYTVNYKLLSDDLTTYEIFETDVLEGLTDTNVTPTVKQYDYYDPPAEQTIKINGNGSSVVEYLYTRRMYTLQLTADKGKNAMSAPTSTYMWGQSVSITITTLAGYKFEQWFDVTEKTQFADVATYTFVMPHKDLTLNAVINPFEVKYTVKHYVQSFNGGYQLLYTDELYAFADTTVTPEFKDYAGFTPISEQVSVNVNGDGSTIVEYYYERGVYKVTIKYSDEVITEITFPYQQNIELFFDEQNLPSPLYAFDKWYTETKDLLIKQPYSTSTSFLMPPRDAYIEAIICDNRKNTNIYKNIFPEEVFNMDMAYECEKQFEKTVFEITQENHKFAVGNVLCLIDGVYYKARAEDSPRCFPVGIVSRVLDENRFQLMKSGMMPYKEQTFTDTTILYLSNLVAGAMGHYKHVSNKIYVPVALYIGGKILINIQDGSIGNELEPYDEYGDALFEPYEESELNECISTVLGGFLNNE